MFFGNASCFLNGNDAELLTVCADKPLTSRIPAPVMPRNSQSFVLASSANPQFSNVTPAKSHCSWLLSKRSTCPSDEPRASISQSLNTICAPFVIWFTMRTAPHPFAARRHPSNSMLPRTSRFREPPYITTPYRLLPTAVQFLNLIETGSSDSRIPGRCMSMPDAALPLN